MIDIEQVKKNILIHIEKTGPSIPAKIGKVINMDTMVTAAILAELTSSGELKMSHMKVGSSQIYFRPGQEQQLEEYAPMYLKSAERDAYNKLKNEKYLIDENEEPAIRVALRALKDFGTPFKYQEKIMWRYNFVPKEELQELLKENQSEIQSQQVLQAQEKIEEQIAENHKSEIIKEEILQEQSRNEKQEETKNEKGLDDQVSEKKFVSPIEEGPVDSKNENKEITNKNESQDDIIKEDQEEIKEEESPSSTFATEVQQHLGKLKVNITEEIEDSRNEYIATIAVYSDLGKLPFLLIARNKKSISDADILVAHQKATDQKMPLLLLHKGKVTKKAQEMIEANYKGLIKVQEMRR